MYVCVHLKALSATASVEENNKHLITYYYDKEKCILRESTVKLRLVVLVCTHAHASNSFLQIFFSHSSKTSSLHDNISTNKSEEQELQATKLLYDFLIHLHFTHIHIRILKTVLFLAT